MVVNDSWREKSPHSLQLIQNTTNMADALKNYELSDGEKVAAIVVYSVASVLAIGANLVLLFLMWRFPRLRSPTNILVANLAVADISMALFCIPFSYWPLLILGYWPFGLVPCKLIFFMQVLKFSLILNLQLDYSE